MSNFQLWIEKGKEKGIKDLEIYSTKVTKLSITVYQGKSEEIVKSDMQNVSIRGIYRNKMGKVSLENFSEDKVDIMIDNLIENAKVVTDKAPAVLYKGAKKYPVIPQELCDFSDVSIARKIELAVLLESEVLKGKNVSQVESTVYQETDATINIINSKGLNVSRSERYAFLYTGGVFAKDDDIQSHYEFKLAKNFKEFDAIKMAKQAIKIGNSKLGGKSLKSGEYKVVFENETFGYLLNAFLSNFSLETAYRNLTTLKDKEGVQIANTNITLTDSPLYKKATFKVPFDDEGVPCKKKNLIEKGIFCGFINNLKMAKVYNKKPTGNSFDGGISPTNLVLEPGKKSLKELFEATGDGVYITGLDGLHAGVQSVSGAFNLQANGYLIKNGKLDHPVKMIVVSGNFFELLKNIIEVGKDLFVSASQIITPSVVVSGLQIAGNE